MLLVQRLDAGAVIAVMCCVHVKITCQECLAVACVYTASHMETHMYTTAKDV